MPFEYYKRLNRGQKAVYRESDGVGEVRLVDPSAAREAVGELREALEGERSTAAQHVAVQRAANRLAREVCAQVSVEPVDIEVLTRRPRSAESELHGLYAWREGDRARITVWMRTAQRKQVVAFKTFVRTLLHELCHHLDYHLLKLAESFHTQGFFRRESSLARQLLPKEKPRPARKKNARKRARPVQMKLF